MTIKNIYIVLGSLNYRTGELNDLATNRLDKCLKVIKNEKSDYKIICTGAFGSNFNNTDKPHFYYLYEYLYENGVDRNLFLEGAPSKNTVDDAVKVKEILEKIEFEKLYIVTSDFHIDRVELIFNIVFDGKWSFKVVPAPSDMTSERQEKLTKHEREAIKAIKKNGLYFE